MEFTPYLLRPALFTELPPRWEEIFGRMAPLAVEIGFGNGEFLAEMAKNSRGLELGGVLRRASPAW